MSQKIKTILLSSVPVIIATLFITAVIYAWTEPSQAPPDGNVPAPINVGSASQYKSGALGIGGLLRSYSNAIFDGNVGIGTANPTQKLDVAGYVKGQSGLCIGNDCRTAWPSGGGGIGGSGTVNYVSKWTAANSLGNSIIYDNGTNVGIGVTTPSQKLDVSGYVRGSTGLCIGNDCRTTWPVGINNCHNVSSALPKTSDGSAVVQACDSGTMVSGGCFCGTPPANELAYLYENRPSGNGWSCRCRTGYTVQTTVRCCN